MEEMRSFKQKGCGGERDDDRSSELSSERKKEGELKEEGDA